MTTLDSAILKIGENLRAGNDALLLSMHERRFLTIESCLGASFVLSPARLDMQLSVRPTGERKPMADILNNLIVMARMAERPVSANPTFRFLKEIVEEGRPYQETGLYRHFAAGRPMRRYVQTAEGVHKIWIRSTEDFASYHEKCMRLAESIRERGMLDVDRPEDYRILPAASRKKDSNIGVAVDRTGKVLLFKSGQHRLALAQLLRLDRIPVLVRLISGEYLKSFIPDVARLDREALFAALRASTDHIRPDGAQAP